jgi:hypothetical protein
MTRRKTPEIKGVHEYANVFPMVSGDELTDLAGDIQRNGLEDPIVVTPEGMILDGRNRYAACKLAGIEPTVKVYDGDDPASFVLSKNISRRHMSPGQRAMAAAVVLNQAGRRVEGRWARGSIAVNHDSVNTSVNNGLSESRTWQNAMSRAGVVLDYAPALIDDVIRGVMALDKAFTLAEAKRPGTKAPKSKTQKSKPPPQRTVLLADLLSTLRGTKPKGLPEVELTQIRAVRRECDRIINDALNGTETTV